MSTRKIKIPSSARRHIKLAQFSQFVSASRLRHVQNILTDRKAGLADLDGILCIAGIDSRYNEGMYELLNYLLFGFFEVRKEELESSGFPEEVIDDMILLICRDHVQVYCNPVNYHYLLPYVSHWPGIQFHCLSDDEYDGEDDDKAEEFKIQSFISMVSDCKILGLPFSGQGHVSEFSPMEIEKWPIIQAFALDEFGGGGFFTLKYEVVDVSAQAHQIQDIQDSVSIELLLTEHLPLMSRQWTNMMQCLQLSLESKLPVLSQKKISEPLKSYFNHGFVGHKGRGGKVPFVLFNQDTYKKQLEKAQNGEITDATDLPVNSKSNHHMVCEVSSPHKPLVCGRTYLFCNKPYDVAKDVSGDGLQHSNDTKSLRYSTKIYLSMVRAVLASIKEYSETLNVIKAKEKCLQIVMNECSKLESNCLSEYLKKSSSIQFKLVALNSDHSEMSLGDGEVCKKLKFVSLCLYDIPSLQSSGNQSIGSMIFAETFLDSCIQVAGSSEMSCDVFILTSCIPRYQIWSLSGQMKKSNPMSALNLPASQWGEHLMTQGDISMMGTWTALLPPEKIVLTAWSHGLTVQTCDYGSFCLHGSDISSMSLYDGDSMSQVILLLLEFNLTSILADHLPPHLYSEVDERGICTIILAFNPHTKAHTQLFGNVLPAWKTESQLPEVKRVTTLNVTTKEIHDYLQNQIDLPTSRDISPLKKVSVTMPHLFDFLEHLTTNCGLYGSVTKDVYHSLVGSCNENIESNEEKIVITIITGAPGSGKNVLADVISSYNTNIMNWVVFKQSEECCLDTANLHKTMTTTAVTQSQWLLSKTTRLIIVAPGFCDTPEVLRAISSYSNHSYRSLFVVGAVTLCVDPLNAYLEHKMPIPMLTAHCAQGWVNNVVFTSQTLAPSELLDSLQSLIRSINNNVALLKAENGQVKRSSDLDLIMSETAFLEPSMERARVLLKPYWREGYPHAWSCQPVMNDVLIQVCNPLEKHLTLINLHNLKKRFKGHPYSENIYYVNGLLAFTSSPQLVNLQFSPLNDKLVLKDIKTNYQSGDNHVYKLTFTGVNLKEQEIKEFLNTCVKQKPEKKKLLTREDLTKQEIDKIHASHHLDDLPEGWYYNGSQFVSMDGERSYTHPNLDKFISDYLETKNRAIAQYNQRIESESYTFLWQQ